MKRKAKKLFIFFKFIFGKNFKYMILKRWYFKILLNYIKRKRNNRRRTKVFFQKKKKKIFLLKARRKKKWKRKKYYYKQRFKRFNKFRNINLYKSFIFTSAKVKSIFRWLRLRRRLKFRRVKKMKIKKKKLLLFILWFRRNIKKNKWRLKRKIKLFKRKLSRKRKNLKIKLRREKRALRWAATMGILQHKKKVKIKNKYIIKKIKLTRKFAIL